MRHKMALRDTIRFRAARKTKSKFTRIAKFYGKKPSDLGREVIDRFVREHESKSKEPLAA